jgi:hypothetical protein
MLRSRRWMVPALIGLAFLATGLSTLAAEPGHFPAYRALVREDAFMVVHMDNQKIGSDVYRHWHAQALSGRQGLADPQMVIHMDNQKIDSDVSAFWRSLAESGL